MLSNYNVPCIERCEEYNGKQNMVPAFTIKIPYVAQVSNSHVCLWHLAGDTQMCPSQQIPGTTDL